MVAVPEVLQRERVHVVPRRGAVEHVGLEHGVELDPGQRDAGAGEHAHVVLEVLADLRRPLGLEDRAELLQHPLACELVGRARIVVAEGDVGGMPGLDCERDAHELRAHVVEAGGLGVERDCRGGFESLEPDVEGRLVQHRLVLGRRGFVGRVAARVEKLAEPGPELEVAVERLERVRVRLGKLQAERADIELHVAPDRDQLLRKRYLIEARPEVLAHLPLDPVGVRDEVLEGPVLGEPPAGCLRPDLRDPGHVVDRVADQGEVVDDGLRRHAELGPDPARVEDRTVHGVDHGDVIVDELGHVLVAGGDEHVEPGLPALLGERADDVVRLDAAYLQNREPERADDGVDGLDLRAQLRGHGRTVRLVLRVPVVAERLALGVEDDRRQLGPNLRLEPLQHVGHAVRGTGRLALGVRERRHRVKRAIQVGGAVHEDEAAAGFGHGTFTCSSPGAGDGAVGVSIAPDARRSRAAGPPRSATVAVVIRLRPGSAPR